MRGLASEHQEHGAYRTHQELKLELHADVADWNPNAGFERQLAVGTYELDEKTQLRHGKLYTYELDLHVDDIEGDPVATTPTASMPQASLRLTHSVDNLPGIFDLQFIPTSPSATTNTTLSSTLVALALADGSVRIVDACNGSELARSSAPDESDAQAMALLVDTLSFPASTALTASFSDGTIHVFDATPDGRLVQTQAWEAHSLEAWVATWSRAPSRRGHVIFSGGDDAVFQAWDLREGNVAGNPTPAQLFLDRKTHGAGVTYITELLGIDGADDTTIITGSYDNTIRTWDWRNTCRPVLQTSFDLGGGVWRLKPHPDDPAVLLAATMYDGFKVVRLVSTAGRDDDGDVGTSNGPRGSLGVEQCAQYPPRDMLTDETLAYGASWCRKQDAIGLIATCSFYDNLLSLWWWPPRQPREDAPTKSG